MRYKKIAATAAAAGALIVAGLVGASTAQAAVQTTTTLTVSTTAVPVGGTTGMLTYSAAAKMTASPYTGVGGTFEYRVDGVLQSGEATIEPKCGRHTVRADFRPTAGSGYAASFDTKTVTVNVVGGTCDNNRRPVHPGPSVSPCRGRLCVPAEETPTIPCGRRCVPTVPPTVIVPGPTPTVIVPGPTVTTTAPVATVTSVYPQPATTTEVVYVTQPVTTVYAPASGTGSPSFTG